MARRRKKQKRTAQTKRTKQTKSTSAAVAPVEVAPDPDAKKRSYWTDKLPRLIERERHREAVEVLDRIWPETQGHINVDRVTWLLLNWPERALSEILPLPEDELNRPRLLACLADVLLGLNAEAVDRLLEHPHTPAPFAAEARALRAASAALSAGDDTSCAEKLRAISLRSPFREGKLFLRGLSSYYQRRDDDAKGAFGRLEASAAYGAAARALNATLDGKRPRDKVEQAIVRDFGGPAYDETAIMKEIVGHLREKHPAKALVALKRGLPSLSEGAVQLLRRELPAVLLRLKLPPSKVLSRLARALPPDPEDARQSRVTALLAGHSGPPRVALEMWLVYLREIDSGACGWSKELVPLAMAAIQQRIASILMRLDSEDAFDADYYSDADLYFDDPYPDDEYWSDSALKTIEQAIELDPNDPTLWRDLLSILKEVDDTKAVTKTVERMVAAFPEDPQTLTRAAELAGERGAFDKGLRYARRAAALEPFNRTLKDLQSSLLCGKARKKLREFGKRGGDKKRVATLYNAAIAVDGGTPTSRSRALAEYAAYQEWCGHLSEVTVLRERALAEQPSQWIWTTHFLLGREYLLTTLDRNRKRIESFRPLDGGERSEPEKSLTSPPTLTELRAVRAANNEIRDALEYRPVMGLGALLQKAFDEGITMLSEEQELHDAMHESKALRTQLAAAEKGSKLFPQVSCFTTTRYELALDLQLGPGYFSSALEELEAIVPKQRSTMGLDTDFWDLSIEEQMERVMRQGRQDPGVNLIERIKRYLQKSQKVKRS